MRVHNNDYIKAKKRLYMTATPRLYSDESKTKANENNAVLCSMDDENLYGYEIYRIGFGEAVENDLLSDYKVLILTLSESSIHPTIQRMLKSTEGEIETSDDTAKLIGCINALSKRILGDNGILEDEDPSPMRRAVAFCQSIKVSKATTDKDSGIKNDANLWAEENENPRYIFDFLLSVITISVKTVLVCENMPKINF